MCITEVGARTLGYINSLKSLALYTVFHRGIYSQNGSAFFINSFCNLLKHSLPLSGIYGLIGVQDKLVQIFIYIVAVMTVINDTGNDIETI